MRSPAIIGILSANSCIPPGGPAIKPRTLLWSASVAIYAVFVAWYTDFGGPLDDEEIAAFMAGVEQRGAISPEGLAMFERFMREDTGRQFLMVNIMELAESPEPVDGIADAEQLMARYMAYMAPELIRRACHPTVMGYAIAPAVDIVGIDNALTWDQGALMRYRSRRAMMEIVANADQAEAHHFKLAALEKTIAFPIEPAIYLSDLRLLLGLLLLAITALIDGRLSRRRVS